MFLGIPYLVFNRCKASENNLVQPNICYNFAFLWFFGKDKVSCYYFPTKVLNRRTRKVRTKIGDRGNSDLRSDHDLIIAVTVCSLEVQGCPEVVSSPRLAAHSNPPEVGIVQRRFTNMLYTIFFLDRG